MAYFKCRKSKSREGGVALLVDERLEQEEVAVPFDLEEIVAVKIKTHLNGPRIHIESLYNPSDKRLNINLFDLFAKNFPHYIILRGLNAKIKSLNNVCNPRGKELKSLIRNSDMCVLNSNKNPTNFHYRNDIKSSSVIDLAKGSKLFQ